MPISICDYLGLDREQFEETGALDAVLEVDSRLFIDPRLVGQSAVPEFSRADQKIQETFSNVFRLLRFSRQPGDQFWSQAKRIFSFGEVRGLCIGYSRRGTAGSGIVT